MSRSKSPLLPLTSAAAPSPTAAHRSSSLPVLSQPSCGSWRRALPRLCWDPRATTPLVSSPQFVTVASESPDLSCAISGSLRPWITAVDLPARALPGVLSPTVGGCRGSGICRLEFCPDFGRSAPDLSPPFSDSPLQYPPLGVGLFSLELVNPSWWKPPDVVLVPDVEAVVPLYFSGGSMVTDPVEEVDIAGPWARMLNKSGLMPLIHSIHVEWGHINCLGLAVFSKPVQFVARKMDCDMGWFWYRDGFDMENGVGS